jgi:hypothetical protein
LASVVYRDISGSSTGGAAHSLLFRDTLEELEKDLDIATYIEHESSIWLGITAGQNDGKKCYVITSHCRLLNPLARKT